jgi:hypothetical protein
MPIFTISFFGKYALFLISSLQVPFILMHLERSADKATMIELLHGKMKKTPL